ncbi:MAG: O-antigen ligase family protein [Clostridia bacterium]|nr:O-antigen ligase family protein [Clostridia bacterium]
MKIKGIITKLENVFDILVCLLLCIITISKGGFYKEDILFPTVAITFLGLGLVIIKLIRNIKNNGIINKSKLVTVLDLGMLLLPLCYILPIIFRKSVSLENSIFEAIRYINFSVIYFIVRSSKNKEMYLKTLLILACMVALFGIDEMSYRLLENVFPNNTIGYLSDNMGNISSVVQYANIAAIIMLVGYTIALYMYEKTKSNVYVFLNILLQACILLTSSRMGLALLLGIVVLFEIYYLKNKLQKKSLLVVLNSVVAIMLSGIISYCSELKLYILAILAPAIVYVFVIIIGAWFSKISQKKQKKKVNIKRNLVAVTLLVVLIFVISIIPTNLVINSQETQNRKTTNFILGENEISIKLDTEKNSKYSVVIYQIYEDFKPEKIYEITSENVVNNEITAKVRTSPGAKFMQFDYIVEEGKIEVVDLRVNDTKIITSYLFLPDRLAFRIKDSITLDLNNTLRFEYYKDAIDIWKISPIFGVGGEGFKLMYQMVQDSTYISSEVHSSPLQIMVESGVLGGFSYLLINILAFIILIKLIKNSNEKTECFTLLLALFAINIMALFDLTMSFAIMTYILAVIIGVAANVCNKSDSNVKDRYDVDNKSGISMINLCVLTISSVILALALSYSINIYRASMIALPKVPEKGSEYYSDKLYEKIVYLEKKLSLDKYNANYMFELHSAYKDYITNLKSTTLSLTTEEDTDYINKQIIEYTVRQKMNVDNMIECEYYSKYALDKVASCYLDNFIYYSQIFEDNFESEEVAYTFYLNYAIKLIRRIEAIGPYNKVANSMCENLCYNYVQELKANNKYLQSLAINNAILELQSMLDKIRSI